MVPSKPPGPTAAVTKAVVAICVFDVPVVAVGATGTPVKTGLFFDPAQIL